jgi:hypothetical protein
MTLEALALTLAGLVLLVVVYRRDRARARAERAALFEPALPLFDGYCVTQRALDYPVLVGSYRGFEVVLEPVVDQVAVRKLPVLWLKASVRSPIPYEGVFDYLARAAGTEFYSPSAELPVRLEVPEDWPQHAVIRTDNPEAMPPSERLSPHMALFEDARAKELLVTPKGVRIVYLIAEARRSSYLFLRSADFRNVRLAPELARELLDRAIRLCQDLAPDEPVEEIQGRAAARR